MVTSDFAYSGYIYCRLVQYNFIYSHLSAYRLFLSKPFTSRAHTAHPAVPIVNPEENYRKSTKMGHVHIRKEREQNDMLPYHLPRYLTPCMSTLFPDKSRTVMVVTIVGDCRISRVPDALILQYLSLSPTIALVLTKAVAVQNVCSRRRQYHWTGQYWL